MLLLLAILGQALGIGEHLATGLLLFAKRFLPRARYATIPLDLVQSPTILSVTLHHRATLPHHSDWSIIGEQGRGRGGGDHLMAPSRPCQQFLPLASPSSLHNNTSWRRGANGPVCQANNYFLNGHLISFQMLLTGMFSQESW